MNNATNAIGNRDETQIAEPLADAIGGDGWAGDPDLPGYDEWLADAEARRAAEYEMDEARMAGLERAG